MTTRDPSPKNNSDPELESAKRLHDTLTAPFERPFDSFGYQAGFDYTPSPDSPVFVQDGVWTTIEGETRLHPEPHQPWSVKLGHDPRLDRIVPTSVEIPVNANLGRARLILQRIAGSGEYLMLTRDDADSEPKLLSTDADEFAKIVYQKDGDASSLSEEYVDQVLIAAGYLAPEVFTSPDDLQEHIAETLGTATKWHRKERIVSVVDDTTTVNLERTSVVLPSSLFAEETEEYTRQSDGRVTATVQYHNPTYRGELVINFDYTDHFVSMPKMTSQRVVPAFDEKIIANHGPDAFQIVSSEPVVLSPDAMDELAEELTTWL